FSTEIPGERRENPRTQRRVPDDDDRRSRHDDRRRRRPALGRKGRGHSARGDILTFSEFTPDNDPRGEHDFGSFTLARPEVLLENRRLRRRHAVRLGGPGRPSEDDPRADHHARGGVLSTIEYLYLTASQ